MAIDSSARIHPSAQVSPEADIGANVEIGPLAVVEGAVRLGANTKINAGAILIGPLTMGQGNVVHSHAVLGDQPQHLKYNGEPTWTEIGDYNIFREHVTVHRGTTHSMKTVIGDQNFFMVNSHVAHDCVIGSRCIIANGALIGGHCTLQDNVVLSGNCALHQFVRVGRLALVSGLSATSKDIPPFIVQQGLDNVSGFNVVGMKRAGMSHAQIHAVRQAFRLLFREGLPLPAAVERMEIEMGDVDVIREMIEFLHRCPKGININRSRFSEAA